MDVTGKHILVVGLARSGFSVARALARRGAVVTVTDKKPPAEFRDLLPQLMKEKVGLELGSQREETFLRHQAIVISPGVPWDMPELQAARAKNIPVYPEVEAASWFLQGTLVGITGSNGKTTTTSLLGDMLKASGFPTFVGGNIGNALSSAVDKEKPGTRFVTELSSFQLEGIHEFHPHVAVMLNLSPNHLDRHPSLEAYSQAKRKIFHNQQGKDYAVLNADDPWVAGLHASVPSRPVYFSRQRQLANGVFLSGGKIYYRTRHLERVLFETRDVTLRGDFNLEDVLAATTAACLLGADFAAIRKAVRGFKAVEHRLEFVREVQGVEFYNNSKATSVDATLKSLEAFEHGVHLILGGKDKGAPYAPLIPLIKERVREVLVIGAAAPLITEQLAGATEIVQAGDLATAVPEAFNRARPGDTVLLAPACSSFDQFKDYEERGRVFKELVNAIRGTGFGARGTGLADSGIQTREPGTGAGRRKPRPLRPEPAPSTAAKEIPPLEPAAVSPLEPAAVIRPEPTLEPTPRPSSEPPAEIRLAAPAQPVAEAKAEMLLKATPEPVAKGKPEAVSEAGPEAKPQPRPESIAATKPEGETTLPVAEHEPKAERPLEATVKAEPETPPEPVPEPAAEVAPQLKPEHLAETVVVPVVEPVVEAKGEKEAEGSGEINPVPVMETKEEAPAEAGPEPVAETTAAAAAEIPPEPIPASEEEAVADHRAHAEPESQTPKSEFPASSPESRIPRSEPHHVELKYVYEVDAIDMPAPDSQTVPGDEPAISISDRTETLEGEEPLPYEARTFMSGVSKSESGVRSSKSEAEKSRSGATPDLQQPDLFGHDEKEGNRD